jgi:hypothetical protein
MMKFFESALKTLAVLCLAALPLLAGCQSGGAEQAARRQPAAPPAPEAHVRVDEAMLRKPHAILGGTVENVGGSPLENLSVELELRRRRDGAVELRRVPVVPAALAPGETGRYSLKVLSEEWSGSRLLRLRSGSRESDVAFKSSPGARRPPERIPVERVVSGKPAPARPRSNGEEFINTPDTATSVP